MKLMQSLNNFVCKSSAPAQNAQQNNYKLVIQSVNLIIRTKKLISTAHGALNGSPINSKYSASLFARLNEAPLNPREPDVYKLRQRFDRSPTGFSHCWSTERRRFCGWLPD